MNKKIFFWILLIVAVIIVYVFSTPAAGAFNPFDISYPVSELGNCNSQQECKVFCDDVSNKDACFDWATKQGIVSEKDVKKRDKIKKLQRNEDPNYNGENMSIEDFGPGGCKTPRECDTFCRMEENLNECLNYSVEHGFMTSEEVTKIKEKANKKGPGGCNSRESCDNFCRQPENMKECMQFSVDEGKISQEEADFLVEQAQLHINQRNPGKPSRPKGSGEPRLDEERATKILNEQGGPGGCKTMQECDNFCGNPDNMETCMNFAAEHSLMPKEEIEKAKKMLTIGGPEGCRGPQECDAFCGKPGNGEICMQFSIDNGLISPEEVSRMKREMEIIKKLDQNAGPGGCRDSRECADFCRDIQHIEECMNFASQNRMMSQEDIESKKNEMRIMQNRVIQTEIRQNQFMVPMNGQRMPFDDERMPPPYKNEMRPPFDENGNRMMPPVNFGPDSKDFEEIKRKMIEEGLTPEEIDRRMREKVEGGMYPSQEYQNDFSREYISDTDGIMPRIKQEEFMPPWNPEMGDKPMMPPYNQERMEGDESGQQPWQPMEVQGKENFVPYPYEGNFPKEGMMYQDGQMPPQDFKPMENYMPSINDGNYMPPTDFKPMYDGGGQGMYPPPSGSEGTPPQGGNYPPPGDYTDQGDKMMPPPGGDYMQGPPPSGDFNMPPPGDSGMPPPPPVSKLFGNSFLSALGSLFGF